MSDKLDTSETLSVGESYLENLRFPKVLSGTELKVGSVDYRLLGYRSPAMLAGLAVAMKDGAGAATLAFIRKFANIAKPRLDLMDEAYGLGYTVRGNRPSVARNVLGLSSEPVSAKQGLVEHPFAVKDQGSRGTCVAFGSVGIFEAAYAKTGKTPERFSEQFHYWNIKQHDGMPDSDGSWVRISAPLFTEDGCALESDWAYNPEWAGEGEGAGQGPPPNGALKNAGNYKSAKSEHLANDNDVDLLKQTILDGKAITFGVPVFESWYKNPETRMTGEVPMPLPNERSVGGHAMAIVGFKDDDSWPGGGYFIIRNSWGDRWAPENKYKAGHGFFPYEYFRQFNDDSWTVSF